MGTEYAYAVAYARSLGNRLLSKTDFDRLSETDSKGAAEYLRAIGYFDKTVSTRSELDMELSAQLKHAWEDILSVCGENTPLEILLIRNDFHNLKAAFKCRIRGMDLKRFMIEPSVFPPRLIAETAGGRFSSVGEPLSSAAEGAAELLAKTGDAQLLDIYLDKMYFGWAYERARNFHSVFFEDYIRRDAELINIGIVARCLREKRSRSFTENAFVPPSERLIGLLNARDVDELCGILEKSGRSAEASALRGGMRVYGRYREAQLSSMFRDAGEGAFGIEPVACYIYEKGEEIKRLRQIMYGLYLRDINNDSV